MDKKAKKKKQKMMMQSRRGVILIAAIAVMVLLVNLITASYSWFTPQSKTGDGMNYSFTGKMRSEDCQMQTFKGTKVTASNKSNYEGKYINQIVYDTTAANSTVGIAANSTQYFRTEILNNDTQNASDISLFIKNMPACTLAVTYPGNSVRTFSSAQTDCYIVRDAYVKHKDIADVNGPGRLEIEWFVKTGSSSASINLSNLYLVYN